MTTGPLFIGTDAATWIGRGLGARIVELPTICFDAAWSNGGIVEDWRAVALAGPTEESVVVAVWQDAPVRQPLLESDLGEWLARVETPFALWFTALSVAAERCAEGGRVVAVVDRPESTASAGWGDVTALADAVEITERSLMLLHGRRGVRFGLVTVDARLGDLEGPDDEVDGGGLIDAVGLLLSDGNRSSSLTTMHIGAGPS
jgi:hypothetical protein